MMLSANAVIIQGCSVCPLCASVAGTQGRRSCVLILSYTLPGTDSDYRSSLGWPNSAT